MIFILFEWIYILTISFIIGGYVFIKIKAKYIQNKGVDFSLISITGLILITILVSFFSIFIKIGLLINLLLLSFCLLFYCMEKSEYKILIQNLNLNIRQNKLYILLFSLSTVYILLMSTSQSNHYDEYYYYLKTIKWIETYPAVPGLANLHSQLGFNSHWFLLQAVFSLSFLNIKCLNDLNGLLCVLIIIYSLKNLRLVYTNGFNIVRGIRSLYIVFIFLFFNESFSIGSSSIDIASTLLTWLFIDLFIEKVLEGNFTRFDFKLFLLIALIPFLITIRLSTLPLVLFLFFLLVLFLKERKYDLVVFTLITYTVILIPFLIRNVILSGYLVFPVYQIDIFSFDWEVTRLSIIDNAEMTKSWSRMPFANKNYVFSLNNQEWIKGWILRLNTKQRLFLGFLFISFVMYVLYFLKSIISDKKIELIRWHFLYVVFALVCGIVFWFTQAPMLRYGLNYLLFAGMMILSAIIYCIQFKIKFITTSFWCITVILISYYSIKATLSIENKKQLLNQYLKPDDFIINPTDTLNDILTNNFILIPKNGDQCGYSAIPCTVPQARNPNLEFRGKSLSNGFRISQNRKHFDW